MSEQSTRDERPARRRRLDPEVRRRQVVVSAREVFTELGATGTRMRDIAARAGITVPYLFRIFGSRDDLYREAIQQPLDQLAHDVVHATRELSGRSDIEQSEKLRRFHRLCMTHFIALAPLLRAQILPREAGEPWFHTELLFPSWQDVVATVISDVTGWKVESIHLDVMVHALMGLYIELAFESDLEQVPLDVDRTADQLVRMFAPRHHADPAGEAGTPATRAAATDESPGPDPARAENADPDDDESARGRLSRAQRRESILVAARALFLEAGLSGARSKDLADRAQITEGFLYQHFSSKEEIYELAVEVPTEQALIELAADIERICQGEHGSTFLQALNERCLRFFVDHGATLTTALLSDLERSRRFYRERVAVHFDGVGAAIAAKMGYDADVIDPELARRAIMGCQWGVSIALRTRYPTSDLSAIARHLTRLFISGVKGGMAAPHGAHMVADQLSG